MNLADDPEACADPYFLLRMNLSFEIGDRSLSKKFLHKLAQT